MDRLYAVLILAVGIYIGMMTAQRLHEVGDVVYIPSWVVDEFTRDQCQPGLRVIPVGGSVEDDLCK
jgi:hypothetical protein